MNKQDLLFFVRTYANINQKTCSRSLFIIDELSDRRILEVIENATSKETAIALVLEFAESCIEYEEELEACKAITLIGNLVEEDISKALELERAINDRALIHERMTNNN